MPVYPAKLPESIRNDPKRAAELKLYDYFKENLPESYSIIYSPEWICNFRRQTGDLKTAEGLKQIGVKLDS